VVIDGSNGRLLHSETVEAFSSALKWAASLPRNEMEQLKIGALRRAEHFSMARSADKALSLYRRLREKEFVHRPEAYDLLRGVRRLIKAEWNFLKGVVSQEPRGEKTS